MARRTYGYYTQGNTARKIDFEPQRRYHTGSAVPKRRYEEEEVPVRRKKKKQLSPRQIKEQEKQRRRASYRYMESDSMSVGHICFLIAMVVVVVFLGVKYLNYQAEISETKSNINALKANIEVLDSQNDAIEYDIEAFIDIEHVIDVATKQLGMTMATPDQVRYYHKDVEEFMNQYADVPET